MAEPPIDSTTRAEEDAVFSTLPELSKLLPSSATACATSPTAKETICRERTRARSGPGLVHPEQEARFSDQEGMYCTGGAASSPGIPAELEENVLLAPTHTSLPPMVDSVTDIMLKVSINQDLGSTEDHRSLVNGERGHIKPHKMGIMVPVKNVDRHDVSLKKEDVKTKPLSSNGKATIVEDDAPSIQMSNCMVGVNNNEALTLGSLSKDGCKLGSDNDDDDDDNDDEEEEEEQEEDGDSGIDTNEEEEVEQGSDSSLSTSSLSFLLSSDDDDEVDSLHRLLNGAHNQKDVVMEVESECEEGELKESPSRRKKCGVKKKSLNENSEDEEGLKEPARSKTKTEGLSYVPKVSVTLKEYHKTVPVGFVSSVVGVSLIVEGFEGQQALNEGSILWLTDQRLPLGIVDELFGPVKKPFYVVRYNDAAEMPEGAKEGAQVSYVRDFADFVLNNPDLYSKGYDESGGEDDSDSEVHFSDDEKEAEYKRSKSSMKRGKLETSTLELNYRQEQEKRAGGKRLNRDNNNWRSRGENARPFQSNHESPGRPPRHQNVRFQHHHSEKESPSANRVETTCMSNERNKHGRRNQSPVRQMQSQQSLGGGKVKPSTPVSSTSEGSVPSPSQVHHRRMNPPQSTHSSSISELAFTSHFCSTSQPAQTNQLLHSISQPRLSNQSQSSQQVQLLHMNQSHNLMQSTLPMNQPHGLVQSTLPANQQQMSLPQLPGIQHLRMPVYSHPVVAGQVPQMAIHGSSLPLANNKPPLSPGMDTMQGVPLAYQSPICRQQPPISNQFPSSMPHHFSAHGSQGPPNIGIPMGNQVPAMPANGFPVGIQPAALAAPVLGIPAGPTSTPFNYPTQMVCNQNFSGFTPGFANQIPPSSTFGVPEPARSMHHVPQDSSGPRSQQSLFHQRHHQPRGSRRF